MLKFVSSSRTIVRGCFILKRLINNGLGLFVLACLLYTPGTRAQVSTGYVWSQSFQTYTAASSTTSTTPSGIVPTLWDDNTYTGYRFPFNFTYNGVLYTGGVGTIGVDTDGWVAFSTTGSITMTGTAAGGSWVSIANHTGVYLSGTANNNGFCGFNSDVEEQVFATFTATGTSGSPTLTGVSDFSNIRVGVRLSGTGITDGTVINAFNTTANTITMSSNATASGATTVTPRTSIYAFIRGIAPYRQFVIQWTRATRFSVVTGDDFSFQLVLNEGGLNPTYQTLQVVYGTVTTTGATAQNAQAGLRGNSAADFNARTTTTNWSGTTAAASNTATCSLTSTVFPLSGLTYTWSPPCSVAATAAGAISGTNPVCPGTSIDYSIAGVPGAIFYNWTYTGGGTTLSATTTLPMNTLNFGMGATSGTLTVTPGNLCGNGASSSLAITVASVGAATITYPLATYCQSTTGTVSPTLTGPAGGTYTASPTGLTITSAGVITPSTSTAGTYTITYTYTSAGCSITTTTTVSVSPDPVVTVSATPSSVCTGGSSQLSAAADAGGNYTVTSIAHSSVAPSGLTTELWGTTYADEAVSSGIALPFTFTYYGQNITQLYVYSNGYISLNTAYASSFTPQTLPNPATPNNVIALAWDDLEVDNVNFPGAYVRYFVNGTAPNRIMVIDYNKLNFFWPFAGNVTGQIRLYEADNHIEVATTTVNDAGDLSVKTLGIENNLGTVAIAPAGRNNVVWNVTNQAWSFSPKPVSYLWSPATFLSGTSIRNPVATAVSATTAYTVRVTDLATGCYQDGTVTVTVASPLNGTYTVGVGGNYTTLTAAVNAYNSLCIGGPVTFSLIDNTYPGETFPIIINNNSYASATNTLTIKPAVGRTPLISGSSATSLIQLFGADYVTIDGSNTVGGTTRDLSITNTAASSRAVLWLTSFSASNGATNNTIKNCKVYGIANGSTGTVGCIIAGSYITAGEDAEFPNNNNTIRNNLLYKAQNAIYLRGKTASLDQNWLITQNNIGSTVTADKLGFRGMGIINSQNFTVTNNTIAGVTIGSAGLNSYGIGIYLNINTGMISENSISDVKHTSLWGAHGIYLGAATTASNLTVQNNFIYDIAAGGFNGFTASDNGYGITVNAGGGYKIYFNTVVLGTNQSLATNTTSHRSAAMLVTNGVTTVGAIDLRNNIFENRQQIGSGNSRYAIISTAANTVYSSINNNGYYNGSTVNASTNLLCKGSNATTYSTLAAIQTQLGGNILSTAGITPATVPVYNSVTDFHLQSVAANSICNNLGTPIAGITTDYDITTRNGLTPDIGADEWLMPNTGSWVGKTSTDWLVNTNWETNKIPDRSIDVTISGGYTFMPTILTTQEIRGLNLTAPVPANTPILTVSGGTIKVHGTIVRTGGSIDASNGTFETDSSIANTIPASLFLNNNLKNLVINNGGGLTLLGTLDIYRSVTFGTAGASLTTNSNLVFKSTATETAWLGNVTGKTIVGTARVERYIPTGINHGKSWQLLSVPIRGNVFLRPTWMENNVSLGNTVPGFGTTISSEVAGATGRGYDFYTAPGPSLKTYVSATNTYIGVDNGTTSTASVNIQNPKGYMLLVRGDRSVQSAAATATPTVLRLSGSLWTATIGQTPATQTVTANKFETIGNPYVSAIDFTLLTKGGGLDNTFYLWDPLLAGSNSLGGYQTFSAITGWMPTPGSPNYSSLVAYSRIQSGQAFFVHATGTNGTVGFTEGAKVQSSQLVMRPGEDADITNRQFLRLNMYRVSRMELGPVDGNVVAFDRNFSNQYNGQDALKMNHADENIGIFSNERQLAIEARKPVKNNDTIFYNISNLRQDTYQLRFGPQDMSSLMMNAFLVDRFLNTMTPVSLYDSTTIDFNITSDAASSAVNRFCLVFKRANHQPPGFVQISASRTSENSITVNWNVENETGIENYEIERSGEGHNFSKLDIARPSANNGKSSGYIHIDEEPLGADNFYRIKATTFSGEIIYSSIVKIGKINGNGFIGAYPNPVVNKNISVSFVNQAAGTYTIRLSNTLGQVMVAKTVLVTSKNAIEVTRLPNDLSSGNYTLVIIHETGKQTTQQVVVN